MPDPTFFIQTLRGRGYRITPQREMIVQALAHQGSHMTAEEIFAEVRTRTQTVNLATGEQVPTQYERSDFCPVPRAVPILEAMISFVLADALLEKLGGDSLAEMLPRFKALPQTRLSDLQMDAKSHVWWPE